jgi:translation initiation factor 1A
MDFKDQTEEQRIRMPRRGELMGTVIEMLGGSRMTVKCFDGKERLCRIPGKIKKKLVIKSGDYVIVQPWSVQSDERGDIAYRYNSFQLDMLKRKGVIK